MVTQVSLLARGATRLTSRIHRGCPRLDPSSAIVTCPTASLSLLTGLTPASPGAPRSTLSHSELSAPPDNKFRFPVFRDAITVPLFREETITAPLPYTYVFCARRRAAGFVTHMFTRALTVCSQRMILTDCACHLQLTYCLNQAWYRDKK